MPIPCPTDGGPPWRGGGTYGLRVKSKVTLCISNSTQTFLLLAMNFKKAAIFLKSSVRHTPLQ